MRTKQYKTKTGVPLHVFKGPGRCTALRHLLAVHRRSELQLIDCLEYQPETSDHPADLPQKEALKIVS